MAVGTHIKSGGVWKEVTGMWRKVSGTWKRVELMEYRIGGLWFDCFRFTDPVLSLVGNDGYVFSTVSTTVAGSATASLTGGFGSVGYSWSVTTVSGPAPTITGAATDTLGLSFTSSPPRIGVYDCECTATDGDSPANVVVGTVRVELEIDNGV